MNNPILIIGANSLGRTAKDIFEGNEVVVYGFLDDDKNLHNTEIDDVSVLGSSDDESFLKLVGKKCESFVAVDDNRVRKSLVKLLNQEYKVQPINAIHKRAVISTRADIGHGNLIDADVLIGNRSKIGNHCILNSRVTIGADTAVGSFSQIGAGAIVGSEVSIEEEVFIGSGVTIVAGVSIGKGARVGAGSVVVAPVGKGETVFGNPAQVVK